MKTHGRHESKVHKHSPLTVGVGLSVFRSLGGEDKGDSSASSSTDGHQHQHLRLHGDSPGGEDAHSEDEQGGGGSGGTNAMVTTTLGYRLTNRFSLNLAASFGAPDGVGDPAFGVGYAVPVKRGLDGSASLTATAPLSKTSQEIYKTTTVTLGAGPTWSRGRFAVHAKAFVAMSFYSKNVIVEEEPESTGAANGLRLVQDETHDHGADDTHAAASAGAGDRELNRYGVASSLNYKLAKQWLLGTGLSAAYVTHQFGASAIETQALVAQGTYLWRSVAASLGLTTTGSSDGLTAPTDPGLLAAIVYTID